MVGDPEDGASWGSWAGISPKEEEKLSKTRRILNSWISEHLIEVFFDKLIKNKARRNFWFRYARHFTVKILSNEQDYEKISHDERLRAEAFSRLGKLKGSATSTGSILVMMSEKYALIEFSATGNAFYAYKKENLPDYGLARLARLVEGDTHTPLNSGDIKRKMPTLSILEEEGRFLHAGAWQDKLEIWLKQHLGV